MSQNLRLLVSFFLALAGAAASTTSPAPEFTQQEPSAWTNSAPLTLSELRGNVILLDVRATPCSDCGPTYEWLNDLQSRFVTQRFRVVGIHGPEVDARRIGQSNQQFSNRPEFSPRSAALRFTNPVMTDRDLAYSRAIGESIAEGSLGGKLVVLDKQGKIRGTFSGEVYPGDSQSVQMERLILSLLLEL